MSVSLGALDFTIPFWDRNTNAVGYATSSNGGFLVDSITGKDMLAWQVTVLAALNCLNPNWPVLYDISQAVFMGDSEGRVEINYYNQAIASVSITQKPDNVDYWYGTDDFARFGLFSWLELGAAAGGVQYINWTEQNFHNHNSNNNGCRFQLVPGVHADLLMIPKVILPDLVWNTITNATFNSNTQNYSD